MEIIKKQNKMKNPTIKAIKILKNEAFNAVSLVTNLSHDELERRIFNRMISENVLFGYDDKEAAGLSVNDLFLEKNSYTLDGMLDVLFNDKRNISEVGEYLKSVVFWGLHNDCKLCGCETRLEGSDYDDDGERIDIKICTNSDCRDETNVLNKFETIEEPLTLLSKIGNSSI